MERKKTLLFSDAIKVSAPKAFNVMAKPAGPKCNLKCSYCYYLDKARMYPASSENRMNDLVLEKFIREYITAQEVPVVTFTWQGGEPSLAGLDFFRKVVELQDKYGGNKRIENSFQTNGTRLTDEWCIFFAERNFLVGISVDGEEHNHDHYRITASGRPTFSQVMKGIELLHKHRVEFNTLSTVNSYNHRFAAETYRFLKKIGSGFIQFLPVVERMNNNGFDTDRQIVPPSFSGDAVVTPWSITGEQYGEFLITIFDEWVRKDVARYYVQIFDSTLANYVGEMPGVCVFSETCGDAMVIEQNGDLYSCDHYVFPDYLLGNINEQSLAELAGMQRQFDFGISKRSSLPKQCVRCEVRYACHGECPKHRILTTSDGETGLNYLCEGYRKFFRHAEPYMEFMAKELNNKRPPANVMNWIRNRENIYVKPSLPGRNDPCPCGSGKKFKNCCASKSLIIS